jgi:hypothetical protein
MTAARALKKTADTPVDPPNTQRGDDDMDWLLEKAHLVSELAQARLRLDDCYDVLYTIAHGIKDWQARKRKADREKLRHDEAMRKADEKLSRMNKT